MDSLTKHPLKAVLLATATIDPKGMPNTARADPAVRLNDYKWALQKWLRATDLPIVFCENSGADLSQLREIPGVDGRVEFLSFMARDFPRYKGKGYGETLILAHALKNSRLISPETLVLKTTGRLFVANYGRIWEKIKDARFDICSGWFYDDLAFGDTRFFAATPDFIQRYFIDMIESLDEREESKMYMEHLMARGVLNHVLAGGQYKAMPEPLSLRGVSGTGNTRVEPWANSRIRRYLRRVKHFVHSE